ncbi:hypothetical protein A2U01_0060487 [Trifolium medium]|uniref:Uncharacterized protein n=1 Tax=Trifolium medium TaxID=97028 RepID=A0A392RUJ4_9FABA|nr:hypothetical protein [Trifolium medium]
MNLRVRYKVRGGKERKEKEMFQFSLRYEENVYYTEFDEEEEMFLMAQEGINMSVKENLSNWVMTLRCR